jgi:signal transduction histidine kinase/CheY-like chemotaxis protein
MNYKLIWKSSPLALKISLTMTLSIIIAVASVTLLSLRREKQTFHQELESQAMLMLDILEHSSKNALYYLDTDLLSDLIKALDEDSIVLSARIYDSKGRIIVDSIDEVLRYRSESDRFGQQLVESDTLLFQWQSNHLLAGKTVKAGNQTLGAISIILSTTPLTQKIVAVENQGILVAFVAAILGIIVALSISHSITNPLKELLKATNQLAAGNLDQEISFKSKDELATLAEAFNSMAKELQETIATLQATKEKADAANQAKSKFLAHMSHELRTPLNSILGFTQLMIRPEMTISPQQQQDYLNIINRSGEHLLSLINDILSMSKIEAGQITLNETSFNLDNLLANLEEMLALKAQSKQLTLNFERSPEVPEYIQTDESKLRQILINLLGNALKFTETGSVRLRLSSKPLLDNSSVNLFFEIEDTGLGIASEELDTLFQSFNQTITGKKQTEGTGLGLPISRQFIEMMGGKITVESVVNQGSTFFFNLPVKLASATKFNPIRLSQPRVKLASEKEDYRILVVEDRWESRQLLVKILSSFGFLVREAINGQEAVSIWESWQPHLIWMDIRMPVMDGYKATKIIKAQPKGKKTTIIAVTASAFEEERSLILAAGCDDFIRKPFRKQDIFDKIQQYLDVSYLNTESAKNNNNSYSLVSALAVTSSDWKAQMHKAATEGREQLMLQLLQQIPQSHSFLADALENLIENFQYEKICDLVGSEFDNSLK